MPDNPRPPLTLPESWDADHMFRLHALRCARCRFALLRRWGYPRRRPIRRRLRPGDPGE